MRLDLDKSTFLIGQQKKKREKEKPSPFNLKLLKFDPQTGLCVKREPEEPDHTKALAQILPSFTTITT